VKLPGAVADDEYEVFRMLAPGLQKLGHLRHRVGVHGRGPGLEHAPSNPRHGVVHRRKPAAIVCLQVRLGREYRCSWGAVEGVEYYPKALAQIGS